MSGLSRDARPIIPESSGVKLADPSSQDDPWRQTHRHGAMIALPLRFVLGPVASDRVSSFAASGSAVT